MSRSITEADLHAWLDGELPEARRAEVESHLATHPHDAQRLEAYRHNERELAAYYETVLAEPVPERLKAVRPPTWRSWIKPAAMAAAWLIIGGVAGWHLHGIEAPAPGVEPPVWARRAAVAHAVYSPEVRHPVEVPAAEEAHLVAWLSKRLGTPLKVPRLDPLGFSLVGGRLLPGEHGPVAQFMYQDTRGQRLTLYIRTGREHSSETAFRYMEEGNLRQFYWIDRGIGYALSGEIRKDDLLRVANAVYQHLNP